MTIPAVRTATTVAGQLLGPWLHGVRLAPSARLAPAPRTRRRVAGVDARHWQRLEAAMYPNDVGGQDDDGAVDQDGKWA